MSLTSIYVGNLPYAAKEEDLVALFSTYGSVTRATLIFDKATGRPRGIAFVEMPDLEAARRAIEALAGKEFLGRPLTINEARNTHTRGAGNTSVAATTHRHPPAPPRSAPAPAAPPAADAAPPAQEPKAPAAAPEPPANPTPPPGNGYHNKLRGV